MKRSSAQRRRDEGLLFRLMPRKLRTGSRSTSAILCGSHGEPHKTRSVRHRLRRQRHEQTCCVQQRRLRTKSFEQRLWQPLRIRWRNEPSTQLAPQRTRDERRSPPAQPATDRTPRHPGRLVDRLQAVVGERTGASEQHHDLHVDSPTQKSHRGWRRAPTAPLTRAAQAQPARPLLGRRSEQTAPRLASVVGSVQAAAAMRAPSGANLLGELLVNGKEPRTKLDIDPRLVRAGIASCLHTTEVRALGQLGSSFPRVSAFRPSANVTRIRARPITSRDQGQLGCPRVGSESGPTVLPLTSTQMTTLPCRVVTTSPCRST